MVQRSIAFCHASYICALDIISFKPVKIRIIYCIPGSSKLTSENKYYNLVDQK